MADRFMIIDKVELLEKDGRVIGRTLFDSAGDSQNIKKGQGGKLEGRWDELDNGIGRAIKFTMRDFKPPGKKETYPFVADFEWVEDKFVEEAQKKVEASKPSYRGRDEDKVDRRTFVMEVGADYRAGLRGKGDILVIAREAFLLDWANGGVKDVKTTKEIPVPFPTPDKLPTEQAVPRVTRVDDTGGGTEVTNAQTLMKYALSHGKEFTPSWARKEALLGDGSITDEEAVEACKLLKKNMNWED